MPLNDGRARETQTLSAPSNRLRRLSTISATKRRVASSPSAPAFLRVHGRYLLARRTLTNAAAVLPGQDRECKRNKRMSAQDRHERIEHVRRNCTLRQTVGVDPAVAENSMQKGQTTPAPMEEEGESAHQHLSLSWCLVK